MDIAINCRSFLNKNYTGIGRYTYHLLKSLSEIDSQNSYLLYARKGLFNHNRKITNFGAKNFFLRIDRFHRGLEKTIGKVDVYHSPSPDSLNIHNGTKIVVTIHDLIFKAFPQGHTQRAIEDTDKHFRQMIERATRIICCSKNTMKDLKKYFSVNEEKVRLVYQGVDKNVFYIIGKEEEGLANSMLKAKGIDCPYILSVGTIEPRKNLENVLHAFSHLKVTGQFTGKLAVVGMMGWLSEGIADTINKLRLKDEVIFLGFVSDQELRYFYNKAEAFVFPSFYEGFGFPIVEAFCCGTAVVTSNVSSCPEVTQDAALTVNPYNPREIAEALARIVNDPQLKRELRDKALKRAGDFNFRKTAEQTLQVYKEAYGSS